MKKYLLFALLTALLPVSKAQTITTVAGGNGMGSAADQLYTPAGIYMDRAGYIYVSDAGNNRIQKFPPGSTSATNGVTIAGGLSTEDPNAYDTASNQLNYPQGIFVDAAGNVYVADTYNQRIIKYPAGSDSATEGVTVAGFIEVPALNGTLPIPLQGPTGLGYPMSVYVDDSGYIYVADEHNYRVQRFPPGSTSGTIGITIAGGNGLGPRGNQIDPTGVVVDSSGNVYVCDAENDRILRFAPGSNDSTYGVTVAGGNGAGSGSNQLDNPNGLYMDARGNIYVSDFGNNRIQWFPAGSDSTTNGTTVAGGNGQGSDANQFNIPAGVFVDSSGNIFVADQYNGRIQEWSPRTSGISCITAYQDYLHLYPNPNNGSFMLESNGNAGNEYIIGDMIGRTIMQQLITSDHQSINAQNLSAGTYTLEIKGSSDKAVRFVVDP